MAQRGQSQRAAARSAERRRSGKIDLLERRTLRPGWRLRPETKFGYDLAVSGEVNRAAWAEVVQELLDDRCKGNKSAFARLVIIDGRAINPRTVYAWLDQAVAVRESSVRAVASGFGLNAIDLLIRVGFYTLEQMPTRPTREEMDEERRRVIEDPDFDDVQKAYILQELDRMEEEDERVLAQLRERDRQRRIERLAAIIEQQRGA